MSQTEPDFSRTGRKKKRNRSNRLLNLLIGIVVVLIVIVSASIFLRNDDEKAVGSDTADEVEINDETDTAQDRDNLEVVEDGAEENGSDDDVDQGIDSVDTDTDATSDDETRNDGTVTIVPSEDEFVAETVIDNSWQPIGTTQTGEHVSLYDGKSVDWEEKKQAIAYATGLPSDSMIFWKIKNGGGPQQSIGIASSRDSKEKYRVYLEWVDGQGWKPVKMDILTTLDFDY